MCVNYRPPTREQLSDTFSVQLPADFDWPEETWADYMAPIIVAEAGGSRRALLASYGIVPRHHIPPDVKRFDTVNQGCPIKNYLTNLT